MKGNTSVKRSHIREAAFILIFEKMFSDDDCESIIASANDAEIFDNEMVGEPVDTIRQENEDGTVLETTVYGLSKEIKDLFVNVVSRTDEIDEIISGYSQKREVRRIDRVTLAILRLAVYECMFDEKVPGNVAISEAVQLSKKYAFENDTLFINGVLGSLSRSGKIPSKSTDREVNE